MQTILINAETSVTPKRTQSEEVRSGDTKWCKETEKSVFMSACDTHTPFFFFAHFVTNGKTSPLQYRAPAFNLSALATVQSFSSV